MHERTKTTESCTFVQVHVHETHESPIGLVHSCAPPCSPAERVKLDWEAAAEAHRLAWGRPRE